MKLFKNLLLVLHLSITLALPAAARANPVSFKNGWGIMPAYSTDWNDLDLNYSFTARDAIGISNFYRDGESSNANFTVARYNRLLKRWNELDSQANIYASIGAGARHDTDEGGDAAGYGALELDYETRRIYLLLGSESLLSDGGPQFSRVRGRIGFSPFTAKIDELNTWLIIQGEYMSDMEDEVEITPLLRLFYNNLAAEVGMSLDGDPFLAAMAHF